MWPELVCSQQYSSYLVTGCQSGLKRLGVLYFFCVYFQFLTSYTLLHTPTFLFHLLSSSRAPFCFELLPETSGKEKYNTSVPSLARSLSKAPSSLLEILSPLEAQLAFLLFRNSSRACIKKCYSKSPLGHF